MFSIQKGMSQTHKSVWLKAKEQKNPSHIIIEGYDFQFWLIYSNSIKSTFIDDLQSILPLLANIKSREKALFMIF